MDKSSDLVRYKATSDMKHRTQYQEEGNTRVESFRLDDPPLQNRQKQRSGSYHLIFNNNNNNSYNINPNLNNHLSFNNAQDNSKINSFYSNINHKVSQDRFKSSEKKRQNNNPQKILQYQQDEPIVTLAFSDSQPSAQKPVIQPTYQSYATPPTKFVEKLSRSTSGLSENDKISNQLNKLALQNSRYRTKSIATIDQQQQPQYLSSSSNNTYFYCPYQQNHLLRNSSSGDTTAAGTYSFTNSSNVKVNPMNVSSDQLSKGSFKKNNGQQPSDFKRNLESFQNQNRQVKQQIQDLNQEDRKKKNKMDITLEELEDLLLKAREGDAAKRVYRMQEEKIKVLERQVENLLGQLSYIKENNENRHVKTLINSNGNDSQKKNQNTIPSYDWQRKDEERKEFQGRLKESNNIAQTAKFNDNQTALESMNQQIIPKVQTVKKLEQIVNLKNENNSGQKQSNSNESSSAGQFLRDRICEELNKNTDDEIITEIHELISFKKQHEHFTNRITTTLKQLAPVDYFKDKQPSLGAAWRFIKETLERYAEMAMEKERLSQLTQHLYGAIALSTKIQGNNENKNG